MKQFVRDTVGLYSWHFVAYCSHFSNTTIQSECSPSNLFFRPYHHGN